jgi:hypothetical protein
MITNDDNDIDEEELKEEDDDDDDDDGHDDALLLLFNRGSMRFTVVVLELLDFVGCTSSSIYHSSSSTVKDTLDQIQLTPPYPSLQLAIEHPPVELILHEGASIACQ